MKRLLFIFLITSLSSALFAKEGECRSSGECQYQIDVIKTFKAQNWRQQDKIDGLLEVIKFEKYEYDRLACNYGDIDSCKAIDMYGDELAPKCNKEYSFTSCFSLREVLTNNHRRFLFYSAHDEDEAGKTVEAMNKFKDSCEKGFPLSCSVIGEKLVLSNKIEEAKKYFEKGCEMGGRIACYSLGEHYRVINNFSKYEENTLNSCSLGLSEACGKLAISYSEEGNHQDFKKSKSYLKRACDLNNNNACELYKKYYN